MANCEHEAYLLETPRCIETVKEKTLKGKSDDIATYCQKCGEPITIHIIWKDA